MNQLSVQVSAGPQKSPRAKIAICISSFFLFLKRNWMTFALLSFFAILLLNKNYIMGLFSNNKTVIEVTVDGRLSDADISPSVVSVKKGDVISLESEGRIVQDLLSIKSFSFLPARDFIILNANGKKFRLAIVAPTEVMIEKDGEISFSVEPEWRDVIPGSFKSISKNTGKGSVGPIKVFVAIRKNYSSKYHNPVPVGIDWGKEKRGDIQTDAALKKAVELHEESQRLLSVMPDKVAETTSGIWDKAFNSYSRKKKEQNEYLKNHQGE